MIITVNEETADIFREFSKEYPDYMVCVERKSLIGINEVVEFLVNISPELITALTTFLIAKYKYSQKEIIIKKDDIMIKLNNINITPEKVMELLNQLEKKRKKK